MTINEIRRTMKMRNLALLLLIVFCQNGMAAESSVSVSPQTVTAPTGDTFTIDIIVDSADNAVYGAQYELYFDNTALNAISQTQGTFLSQDGENTNVPADIINNTLGKIVYGEARMGAPAGVTGSGTLASITFEAVKSGTSGLTLSYVMLMDPTGEIATTVNSGTCTITGLGKTPVPETTYTDISIEEANNLIKSNPEVIILDVSTRDEYDSEHITNAIWIEVSNTTAISELDEYMDHDIIVYSADGVGSREACNVLTEHGFGSVYNTVGGLAAWRVNFPVFSAPKVIPTTSVAPSPPETVSAASTPTISDSSPTSKKLPGFEVSFTIAGLLAVLILRRKNVRR